MPVRRSGEPGFSNRVKPFRIRLIKKRQKPTRRMSGTAFKRMRTQSPVCAWPTPFVLPVPLEETSFQSMTPKKTMEIQNNKVLAVELVFLITAYDALALGKSVQGPCQ